MGFAVYAVDRRIPLPLDVLARLRSSIKIQPSCSPDIVMLNKPKMWALLLECKASGFGPCSSQAIQARTLLLVCGTQIGNHFGVGSLQSSLLAFVLPSKDLVLQRERLSVLADEIKKYGQVPGDYQVWGLTKREDGIYLSEIRPAPCINMTGDIRVIGTEDPDGYDVIRFVPLDPAVNANDPVGRQILQERLRNNLTRTILCQLSSESSSVTVSVTALCSAIVLYVWPLWNPESQRYFRLGVRRYVRDIIGRLESIGVTKLPSEDPDRLVLGIPSPGVAQDVRKLLLSSGNRKSPVFIGPQEPLPLDPGD